jgi:predicted adenylyl cyclase CyaB
MKEIEIKIKLSNGFYNTQFNNEMIVQESVIIKDIYYDTKELDYVKNDKVLRLRIFGESGMIAYKGSREKSLNNLIIRDEYETMIGDPIIIDKILISMGFIYRDIVEKERTKLINKNFLNLHITIDKYPFIGSYIEVEGDERDIYSFCERYNLNMNDLENKNCTESFLEFCSINNIILDNPRIQFTFQDEQKYK